MIQTPVQNYCVSTANNASSVAIPYISNTFPLPTDVNFSVGKRWIDKSANNIYTLTKQQYNVVYKTIISIWLVIGSENGPILGFHPNTDLDPVVPNFGQISLLSGSSNLIVQGSPYQVALKLIPNPSINTINLENVNSKINFSDVSSNTSFIGKAGPLIGGQITVTTSACKSTSWILISPKALATNIANGSFTIEIGSGTSFPADTIFNYWIINNS